MSTEKLKCNIDACQIACTKIFEIPEFSKYTQIEKYYIRSYISVVWHKFKYDSYDECDEQQQLERIKHHNDMKNTIKEMESMECHEQKNILMQVANQLIMDCKQLKKKGNHLSNNFIL
jgi:hypothetical protein